MRAAILALAAAALAITAIAPGTATADAGVTASGTAAAARPTAISVQLATLDRTGAAIQAERANGWRKTSVAAALGIRTAAGGDFDSMTVGAGLELRRWLGRSFAMRGWYLAARTDLARTTVDDTLDDRRVGTLTTWSLGASVGYRLVLWRHLELTPSLGLATVVETGTMSPATARGAGIVGLTAGAIF